MRTAGALVLFAGEHAVEEDGELARDGDDRCVVAAAGADPLVEGVHGPGLLGDERAASTSAHRARGEPCLEIRPPRAGPEPDW